MRRIRAYCESLGIFLLISLASSTSLTTSDGYDLVKDVDLQGMHVYWMACQDLDNESLPMSCRVTRESLYEKKELKFCDLKLNAKHIKKVQALTKDVVALSWYAHYKDNYQLAITTVNLTNCNSIDAKINRSLYLFDIVFDAFRFATTFTTGHGKFHTLFSIPDACSGVVCKLTFDAEGKQFKITDFYKGAFKKHKSVEDIKKFNFYEENYLVTLSGGSKNEYYLLTSRGFHLLHKCDLSKKPRESTTHGTILFCQKVNDDPEKIQGKINCTVFNIESQATSHFNVTLDHKVDDYEIENLPSGEFLLFTHTERWRQSYVTKVTTNAETTKTIELQIGLSNHPEIQDTKYLCVNKGGLKIVNDKYCRSVLRLCYEGSGLQDYYGRKCFREEDFQ